MIVLRASSRTISRSFCRPDGNTRSHCLQGACETGLCRSGPSPQADIIFALEHCHLVAQLVKNPPAKHVRLFATPWAIASQVPVSMGLFRQEYWSGLPCSLLQGIFLTQRSNPCLLHLLQGQVGSSPLEPPGKLHIGVEWALNPV